MATKHQTFKIKVNEKYSRKEKMAIAQDIIDFVVERSLKGKDKNNRKFRPGLSTRYSKSPEGQAAGKKAGQTPNMRLSGDMLNALGELIKINRDNVEIGYKEGSQENAKADGNVRGTYGKPRPRPSMDRDFMGITEKDLKRITDRYPIDDKEKRGLSSAIGSAIVSAAKSAIDKKDKGK